MITPSERAYITKHAYVPEHLPDYVSAISGTEPFLFADFVVHVGANRLIFVGYPLGENWNETKFLQALDRAKTHFEPSMISIIAPELPSSLTEYTSSPPDDYYRLKLAQLVVPKKTRNMLRRAQREVHIGIGEFTREHKGLIKAFLRQHQFDDATRFIFQRVYEYVKCDQAYIFDARNSRGNLVAFDVAEFGAQDYAFYMFNFRSSKYNIPGVSDLLLAQIVDHAQKQGKAHLNLGLGINSGVTFFKKKWGAVPFLKHITWVQESFGQGQWWEMIDRLSR